MCCAGTGNVSKEHLQEFDVHTVRMSLKGLRKNKILRYGQQWTLKEGWLAGWFYVLRRMEGNFGAVQVCQSTETV